MSNDNLCVLGYIIVDSSTLDHVLSILSKYNLSNIDERYFRRRIDSTGFSIVSVWNDRDVGSRHYFNTIPPECKEDTPVVDARTLEVYTVADAVVSGRGNLYNKLQ